MTCMQGSKPCRVRDFGAVWLEKRGLTYSALRIGKSSYVNRNSWLGETLFGKKPLNSKYGDYVLKGLSYLQKRPKGNRKQLSVKWNV